MSSGRNVSVGTQSPSSANPEASQIDQDDDDMDYEPDAETTETTTEDDEDDEDVEYTDAQEEISGGQAISLLDILTADGTVVIERETQTGTETEAQQGTQTPVPAEPARRPPMTITRSDLLQLISHQPMLRRLFYSHATAVDDDDETEAEVTSGRTRAARSRQARNCSDPPVPSPQGRDLMDSGNFGTNERAEGHFERKKQLTARIMRRELGLGSPGKQRSSNRIASQGMIPSSNADTIIHYDHRCYSGQFSDDGNFFFACSQDFRVRMYDTSNPYNWVYYKTVVYPYGQWTITDATLSPDNKYLAYSSIKSIVCLAPTDPGEDTDPYHLNLSNLGGRGSAAYGGYGPGQFGIWSIRFSGDGREIVAGTSDNSVYVYDIESRQSILRIRGHDDDVNAVCFGDKSSPHLLYSGSDDTTLKVWDRRSMGDSREAGVFLGHTEGLTYVDSKGDGRYVLSNGKDQTMKLWDLRKMMPTEKVSGMDLTQYSTGFDYRFQTYDDTYRKHPHDCSLVTFKGHKVLKTLIRCHFSPPGSTDSCYVYTGSEDGGVYIYNLDATLAGKVDVNQATQNTRPRGDEDPELLDFYDDRHGSQWKTCVRDASWHPNAPIIAATSWNGYGMTQGTCTVHAWNDGLGDDEAEPKMGQRVDAVLQKNPRLYEDQQEMGARQQRAARMQHARARLHRRAAGDDDNDD